jgi:phosphoadenosine phosphosulfate reductase
MTPSLADPITASFEDKFIGLSAINLLRWSSDEFADDLVVSTSFGIQSAVTLTLATMVKPDIKVVWVDTGYLPDETHAYARTLTNLLNLNLHVYRSPMSPAQMESTYGRLWESDEVKDLNLYDNIRKVEPMQRALGELKARGWVSGLRASQTEYRKRLPPLKRTGSRFRIYPILEWTNQDVYYFMEENDLPQHPLFSQGYTTVGDAHSSRPMSHEDSTDRDTRFRGKKQECGLHSA